MERFSQSMKARIFPIQTGVFISVLHERDAKELGVWANERVRISNKRNGLEITSVIDLTNSFVSENEVGLFFDCKKALDVNEGEELVVQAAEKPKSVFSIKRKMNREKLSQEEFLQIVHDIEQNNLSEIEASAFVSAVYINGLDTDETVFLTKALVEHGRKLRIDKSPVVDKHSVGGTNGRATMIVVPILAAAGLFIPKTSSRSITSAAGTADVMEVLANVRLNLDQMQKITEDVGGMVAWGGAVDLAPADDKIIKIEHPLSLDPEGQVIASVMAKKASVSTKFLVIDIPIGPTVKVKSHEQAVRMAQKFILVGRELGISTEVVLTNGTEPSGRYFGPALEARGVLEILENKYFDNLAQKSCELAGTLLELAGKAEKGKGTIHAKEILKSGRALEKFRQIIRAQGGHILDSAAVPVAPLKQSIVSAEEGQIEEFDMTRLTTIARLAGAPHDALAGLELFIEPHANVKKGQKLFDIHASNQRKLELANQFATENPAIRLEKIILEKFV